MDLMAVLLGFIINYVVGKAKENAPEIPSRVVLAFMTIIFTTIFAVVQKIRPEVWSWIMQFGWIMFSSSVATYEYLLRLLEKKE